MNSSAAKFITIAENAKLQFCFSAQLLMKHPVVAFHVLRTVEGGGRLGIITTPALLCSLGMGKMEKVKWTLENKSQRREGGGKRGSEEM